MYVYTLYSADAVAVHVIVRSFLQLGEFEKLRDLMAWVLSFWTEDMHFYPYLLALLVCAILLSLSLFF